MVVNVKGDSAPSVLPVSKHQAIHSYKITATALSVCVQHSLRDAESTDFRRRGINQNTVESPVHFSLMFWPPSER